MHFRYGRNISTLEACKSVKLRLTRRLHRNMQNALCCGYRKSFVGDGGLLSELQLPEKEELQLNLFVRYSSHLITNSMNIRNKEQNPRFNFHAVSYIIP